MNKLRHIVAFPFVVVSYILLGFGIIILAIASKIDAVDHVLGLYKEVRELVREREVIS